ncbi:MAG: hypothetical protein HRT58_10035 [Crocinitomicaceae bacterium]|nr:hypothetical protein [Flavobacteriales bacterium]NQZ35993.1 hypothetical protein [Crocinitomicaceae bacterium]
MNKFKSIILAIFFVPTICFGQEHFGYYGKKSFIDIGASFFSPLFYNFTTKGGGKPSSIGTGLEKSKKWLIADSRVSLGHSFSTKFGASIEAGYCKYETYGVVLKNFDSFGPSAIRNHENLIINSFLFMPKIELSGRNGFLPNGLCHQIGIGLVVNKPLQKAYLIEFIAGSFKGGENASDAVKEEIVQGFKLDVPIRTFKVMYGIKMRSPLTKSLMINYGVQYSLDFGIGPLGGNPHIYSEIQKFQFRNLISLDLGLTIPLKTSFSR